MHLQLAAGQLLGVPAAGHILVHAAALDAVTAHRLEQLTRAGVAAVCRRLAAIAAFKSSHHAAAAAAAAVRGRPAVAVRQAAAPVGMEFVPSRITGLAVAAGAAAGRSEAAVDRRTVGHARAGRAKGRVVGGGQPRIAREVRWQAA